MKPEVTNEILDILAADARCPVDEIATRTGESVAEVEAEVKRLEDEKIILKYTVLVDWEKAAHDHVFAFIDVRATPEHGVGFDRVAEYIARFDEVHSLYLMSGNYDLLVVVQGHDFRDIAEFVAEKLAPIPQVSSTSTSFVLKNYKRDGIFVGPKRRDERLAVTP